MRTVLDGGPELLGMEDPLEAEMWASGILGTFYKLPVPLDARDDLEQALWPAVFRKAEMTGDEAGLAVLEALSAVAGDDLAVDTRAAANRLRARGIREPKWAEEIGTAVFESAWMMTDVYGDHEAYFATFRYPGRKPHILNALYDKAMGEIIKDGFAGYSREDLRGSTKPEPGVLIADADPGAMARRVVDAIETGDMYLDNEWTTAFKQARALLLARMPLLPAQPPAEPAPAPTDDERAALTAEFLASPFAVVGEEAEEIVAHCLDYRCDYSGDDPFRWSPIVVELFMLDYLPRRAMLHMRQVRAMPKVLRAWIRFGLTKRGLEERWIAETEEAVDQFAKEFRQAATDGERFGPAKAVVSAMFADGIDLNDAGAMEDWLAAFNARPYEERDRLLGPSLSPHE